MTSNCNEKYTYDELLIKKGSDIGYGDLLMTSEWCLKRKEIIERDHNKCKVCKAEETIFLERGLHVNVDFIYENFEVEPVLRDADKQIILHVHHTYYILDKLPWEYDNDSLLTLCHNCHYDLHKDEEIPVYSSTGELLARISPCERCNGSGYLQQYSYVKGGVCFKCNGAKYNRLFNFIS
jgi:RNA polymerase subunit RPABC4/transcription elongation factor Spt4